MLVGCNAGITAIDIDIDVSNCPQYTRISRLCVCVCVLNAAVFLCICWLYYQLQNNSTW